MIAGLRILERFGDLLVTESHPKALLWLLGYARPGKAAAEVDAEALCECIRFREDWKFNPHERDAALCALTSWAQASRQASWKDISTKDEDSDKLTLLPKLPAYWMPE